MKVTDLLKALRQAAVYALQHETGTCCEFALWTHEVEYLLNAGILLAEGAAFQLTADLVADATPGVPYLAEEYPEHFALKVPGEYSHAWLVFEPANWEPGRLVAVVSIDDKGKVYQTKTIPADAE